MAGRLRAAVREGMASRGATGSLADELLAERAADTSTEPVAPDADPVVQAIRQLNRQGDIKLLTLLGQLDGVQRVADGDACANTGYSLAALGWNEADVLMRLMLGQDPLVDEHVTPIRTITGDNVGELDLTQEGWESGAWQTDQDFRAMYRELWPATT